jgi:hypothetical protein
MSPTSATISEESEFSKKFNAVEKEIKGHRAFNHPLFTYLKEQANDGFNATQFQIYRDNFLFRTELTIPSVARALEKAALTGDLQAVAATVRNLYDECGYGDHNLVHIKLLLDSHNKHGQKIFAISPLDELAQVYNSLLLVDGVYQYRDSKINVFNHPYPYIMGNTWAHELAADGMLDNFRQALFESYKGYYDQEGYEKVTSYYKAHKDDEVDGGDIEANHGRMARADAERACKGDMKMAAEMRRGAIEFLDRQAKLWDDLQKSMENAKENGPKIAPKPHFEKPRNTTSRAVVLKSQILATSKL